MLIPNMVLGWRYSVGNAYQVFEFPESLATAEVVGGFGCTRLAPAERLRFTKHLAATDAADVTQGSLLALGTNTGAIGRRQVSSSRAVATGHRSCGRDDAAQRTAASSPRPAAAVHDDRASHLARRPGGAA